MKKKKEFEFQIRCYAQSDFYVIYYREKRRFNLFNFWVLLTEVWRLSDIKPVRDQPCFFSNVRSAKDFIIGFKDDPNRLDHFKQVNDELYERWISEFNQYRKSKDIVIKL